MKKLYLIRHGQSELNVRRDVYGGRSGWAQLSQQGVWQSKDLGRRFKQELVSCDRVVASTAVRAQQTARYCLEVCHIPFYRIETFQALEELDRGIYTERPRLDIKDYNLDPWNYRPPQGESHQDALNRFQVWAEKEFYTKPYKATWMFSHGRFIKSIIVGMFGLQKSLVRRLHIPNTCLIELKYESSQWKLNRSDVAVEGIRCTFEGVESSAKPSGVSSVSC